MPDPIPAEGVQTPDGPDQGPREEVRPFRPRPRNDFLTSEDVAAGLRWAAVERNRGDSVAADMILRQLHRSAVRTWGVGHQQLAPIEAAVRRWNVRIEARAVPDQSPVSPITEDMVEAVERAWPKVWLDDDLDWRGSLRALLQAALAGCTLVDQSPAREHLQPSISDRGFKGLPALPSTYGGTVSVYESSAASGPHLWLRIESHDGASTAHLTLDTASQLAQQLLWTIAHHYQVESGGEQRG